MNEQDVRVLVREAIERHLGRPEPREGVRALNPHPSHVFLTVLPGSEVDEGMCVIEPRVRCNHCGFCQSYGH
jgi:hypothetical protein